MRHGILILIIATAGLIACEPPVEAPEETGELTRYLFANFGSETGDELAAGAVNLESYLATVDLTAEDKDRAVTLPELTADDLGGAVAPDGVEADAQVPVGVTNQSVNDVDAALTLITDPNQVCIANNSYVYYRRTFDGDTGCFVDGSCTQLTATAEIRYESLLAKIWIDETQEFRRVDLEDGRVAVYQRGWIDQSFLSDNEESSWDQRYTLNVWIPDADDTSKTWRFLAFWSSVQMPLITDDAYANLVVEGIDEGFVNEDAFLAGEECSNDRDYEPED